MRRQRPRSSGRGPARRSASGATKSARAGADGSSYALFAASLVLMVNAVVGDNGYLATLRASREYVSLLTALDHAAGRKPAAAAGG